MTIKKLITEEFVRHHYLKRIKVASLDLDLGSQFVFEWGYRAIIEFKCSDILRFVKDIYGEPDNSIWIKMGQRAEKDDAKREKLISANSYYVEQEQEVLDFDIGVLDIKPVEIKRNNRLGTNGRPKRSDMIGASTVTKPSKRTTKRVIENVEIEALETAINKKRRSTRKKYVTNSDYEQSLILENNNHSSSTELL